MTVWQLEQYMTATWQYDNQYIKQDLHQDNLSTQYTWHLWLLMTSSRCQNKTVISTAEKPGEYLKWAQIISGVVCNVWMSVLEGWLIGGVASLLPASYPVNRQNSVYVAVKTAKIKYKIFNFSVFYINTSCKLDIYICVCVCVCVRACYVRAIMYMKHLRATYILYISIIIYKETLTTSCIFCNGVCKVLVCSIWDLAISYILFGYSL